MPHDGIYRSPLGDVEVPDVLLTEFVLRKAEQVAAKPALIEAASGRTVTYAELADGVRRFAGGLVARGLAPGDVVAIMAPNCPEYATAFLGVAHAGGTVTTVNPGFTEREVRHELQDSKPTLMITVSALLDTARAAADGAIDDIVVMDLAVGTTHYSELFGDPIAAPVAVALDAPVAIPYSSGTTGLSKGVVLTHRNLVVNALQTILPLGLVEEDVVMAVLPFFHIYGMQVIMNSTLAVGGTIVTMPRFDLEGFLRAHQDHGITRSYVAPPIAVQLAKQPIVDDFDLSGLRQVFSGAAPLSAEVANEIEARIGCVVEQGYGMTELAGASHLTPRSGSKPGTVGVTVPCAQTMIVDLETGTPVGAGVDGEVLVRGPMVMAGYLNNPQATANTIEADGWLHTGDIGHMDEDGYLTIADRLKELIKYNAWQVAPAELEAVLLTHPAVADAAVIGRPDDEAGEIPVGFVVLKPGAHVTEDDIMAYVAGQVAGYKQLRQLQFIDAIPKSPSGKILRRLLRDRQKVVIEPFVIDVPDATLADLRERLARTRFPNEIAGIGWEQGTPLASLQGLVEYWRDDYDWRAQEQALNSYDNFVAEIEGQRIHFLHVRSPHANATPLLLAHGWPGSIVEFLDTIAPFTDPPDPADAFSLVIPSLPGYAFSAPTTERGWNPRRIAAAFGALMRELGYERYGVQGGDWGSMIVCNMADLFPEQVIGLHVNFLTVPPPKGEAPPEASAVRQRFDTTGSGYQQIQGTKPQTIGYLLDDSPAGLAGWILEKFREWSDCEGDPENVFTKDQMLTNIMLYWVNTAATSSARLYWEMRQSGTQAVPRKKVTVPTGVANFPGEMGRCERVHAERRYNIVHWTEHERGGHFAAMEQPDVFVEDVRAFFRVLSSTSPS